MSTLVGGETYTLLGEEDTSTYSCMDMCTYSKEGEADSKYCFAEGDLEEECKDSKDSKESTASAGGAAGTTTGGSGEGWCRLISLCVAAV